jgi:hypothetical protein
MVVRGSTQNRAADNAIEPGKKQGRCNRPVSGARQRRRPDAGRQLSARVTRLKGVQRAGFRPGSVTVIVVRRALVARMVVVVRVRTGVQIVVAVLMLAFLGTVAVRVRMCMGMLVRVGVRMRVRVKEIAVPVPVFVLVRVVVRVLVQVIVRVAGGAGGLVMRHGWIREGSEPRTYTSQPVAGKRFLPTVSSV